MWAIGLSSIFFAKRPYLHNFPVKITESNYKKMMLEKLDLDMSRVHFVDKLPYDKYIKLLQISFFCKLYRLFWNRKKLRLPLLYYSALWAGLQEKRRKLPGWKYRRIKQNGCTAAKSLL
jgi:hypothetical protein